MTDIKPGIYEMSEKEYRSMPGLNWSAFRLCLRAPRACKYYLDNPQPVTQPMKDGTRAHIATLEPELFASTYAVLPPIEKQHVSFLQYDAGWQWETLDGATKGGFATKKAAQDDAPFYTWRGFDGGFSKKAEAASARGRMYAGKELCTLEEQRTAFAIADAVEQDPFAGDLLACSDQREFVAVWEQEAEGPHGKTVLCKGKIDAYDATRGAIWDLKTTRKLDLKSFKYAIRDRWYHAQLAFYANGCRMAAEQSGIKMPINRAGIVAVTSTPPHLVTTMWLSQDTIRRGDVLARKALRKYVTAQATGIWPDQYSEIIEIDIF